MTHLRKYPIILKLTLLITMNGFTQTAVEKLITFERLSM